MNKKKKDRIEIVVNLFEGRADKFLADYFRKHNIPISRNDVQDLISEGRIIINGKPASKPSDTVKKGDRILTPATPPDSAMNLIAQDIPLTIIYEDEHLMVIKKDYNMVVHPAVGHRDGTIVNALLHYLSESNFKSVGPKSRPGIVHRLDKDTTGLMLVAKSNIGFKRLQRMIRRREVNRIYLALVHGQLPQKEARIETPYGRDIRDRKKMSINAVNPKLAITEYVVVQTFKKFSLVRFKLITGRTHQIRVHMATLGCPVVGDITYGKDHRYLEVYNEKIRLEHHFLHATVLEFKHPVTEEKLSFEYPLPKQFEFILNLLQRNEYGRETKI